jgi:trimethylamine--corrinoid protein Co-methyltransferase
MEVNDDEIAIEVIEKVGPKGQFLAHPHTFNNFRKLHISRFSDRTSYAAWEAGGRKDTTSIVKSEVQRILANHKTIPLPEDIKKKLVQIEECAAKTKG